MAFDGIAVSAVVKELNEQLSGGRITKIAQPEKEEIVLTVKKDAESLRLFVNASAGMPSIYFTPENKPSPMTAPNFCMVLRKHLQGGRILEVTEPGLERVVRIAVEHLDEMGDLCKRILVFELMGKHSNLILIDEKDIIIDSLKHVSALVSSVREVLPGRTYFIPKTEEKADPKLLMQSGQTAGNNAADTGALQTENRTNSNSLRVAYDSAMEKPLPVFKRIYTFFTGLSPQVAMELCNAAGVDGERDFTAPEEKEKLYQTFFEYMKKVEDGDFSPAILYENDRIRDFETVDLSACEKRRFESVSEMLYTYYHDKNKADVMRSKSADLKKHIQTILERDYKKLDIQKKQQSDAEKLDKYKIYGELLTAYAYQLNDGEKSVKVLNYYDNSEVSIPLDENKSIRENASRYYEKYNKCKRTLEALKEQIAENEEEIGYLESILTYIGISGSEEELLQIRRELAERGFVKRIYMIIPGSGSGNGGSRKGKENKKNASGKGPVRQGKVRPLHYLTEDGYDIYVGKNNYQNEMVTFEIATGNDWWFHAKGVPGAHVVVKCSFANQAEEWDMPDEIFELAGALAAVNSRNKEMEKVEIDYLRKKNIKRPNNAAPGFVVYYTNYSLVAKTDLSGYSFKQV